MGRGFGREFETGGGITPSRFAGHSVLCPYDGKGNANSLAATAGRMARR
jgi:hypothetical protein